MYRKFVTGGVQRARLYFEPLSGPFIEGFCKGRAENEPNRKWGLL